MNDKNYKVPEWVEWVKSWPEWAKLLLTWAVVIVVLWLAFQAPWGSGSPVDCYATPQYC